jgi:type IV fimbrial biogenesis protein FimT
MNANLCASAAPSGFGPPRQAHGLTLLELLVGLSVMGVLGALALPAVGARMERQRLVLAAETLAADLTEARFEAVRRAVPVTVTAQAGRQWCWSLHGSGALPSHVMATAGGHAPSACPQPAMRHVSERAHPGVVMALGNSNRLQADGTAQAATVAVFESPRGERLRVDLLALGRSRICAANTPLHRYPSC